MVFWFGSFDCLLFAGFDGFRQPLDPNDFTAFIYAENHATIRSPASQKLCD